MLQLSPARKNKINLLDYDCKQDIDNRMLMSDFSPFDLRILEEILYSPIKFSFHKLLRATSSDEQQLKETVESFQRAGLLSFDGETITVDKEKRKYFEFQIQRFDPDFKPDMEFIQALLKKAPIHVLPVWYSLPRSSNNIFESIVEKHLLSPQIYQRYLQELNFGEPKIQAVMHEVLHSPELQVSSSDLISKYNLDRREFEEIMLLLEFNFVCCLRYIREDDHWLEVITPFHEWAEYVRFLRRTETATIDPNSKIVKVRERDYAFLEDASAVLAAAQKTPLPTGSVAAQFQLTDSYAEHLIQKICLVRLAEVRDEKLYPLEACSEFLDKSLENRALFLYRHSQNKILAYPLASGVATERNIRECEKTIRRALHGKWVLLDEFLKGILIPLSENSVISLKKTGKTWRYTLPSYTKDEYDLVKATICEWLFEAGLVTLGHIDGKECFAVTAFGRFFFEE